MVGKPFKSEHLSFEEASMDLAFAKVIAWIEQFLCAPHADLGRDGDVCPFARAAMVKNSVEYFRNESESVTSLEEDIGMHMLDFADTARANIYSCRIIVPTRLEHAERAVEEVQRRWKPHFVQRHLMLGQFFQNCQESGLWNKDFRPLQTPVPLLAIRNMVPTDIAFLYHEKTYVQTYLEKFGKRGTLALKQFEMTRDEMTREMSK
jgi:hypothetical protein